MRRIAAAADGNPGRLHDDDAASVHLARCATETASWTRAHPGLARTSAGAAHCPISPCELHDEHATPSIAPSKHDGPVRGIVRAAAWAEVVMPAFAPPPSGPYRRARAPGGSARPWVDAPSIRPRRHRRHVHPLGDPPRHARAARGALARADVIDLVLASIAAMSAAVGFARVLRMDRGDADEP